MIFDIDCSFGFGKDFGEGFGDDFDVATTSLMEMVCLTAVGLLITAIGGEGFNFIFLLTVLHIIFDLDSVEIHDGDFDRDGGLYLELVWLSSFDIFIDFDCFITVLIMSGTSSADFGIGVDIDCSFGFGDFGDTATFLMVSVALTAVGSLVKAICCEGFILVLLFTVLLLLLGLHLVEINVGDFEGDLDFDLNWLWLSHVGIFGIFSFGAV